MCVCVYVCRESCDTVGSGDLKDGDVAHETIWAECHKLICSREGAVTGASNFFDNPYYAKQPSGKTRCFDLSGQQVTRLNVPHTVPSNLCKMVPELPEQCSWKQGMLLLGMRGAKHADLYVEAQVRYRGDSTVSRKEGAGLFTHGGNPLYYTMKGTSEDVAK